MKQLFGTGIGGVGGGLLGGILGKSAGIAALGTAFSGLWPGVILIGLLGGAAGFISTGFFRD